MYVIRDPVGNNNSSIAIKVLLPTYTQDNCFKVVLKFTLKHTPFKEILLFISW